MNIEIVAFIHGLSNKRLDLTVEIINKTKARILLFCGHTIGFVNEIKEMRKLILNKKTYVIFELQDINSDKLSNCLYWINNGKILSLYSNQLFSRSQEIEGNYELADRMLYEFENKRTLMIDGYKILIIQCGELNIIKNHQNDNNNALFRLYDDKLLTKRFKTLLENVNIVLNPIHTPMGNQGKMHKRRELLSKHNTYYFSTSNTKEGLKDLNLDSLQYAYYNGNHITEIDREITSFSISRIYNIK